MQPRFYFIINFIFPKEMLSSQKKSSSNKAQDPITTGNPSQDKRRLNKLIVQWEDMTFDESFLSSLPENLNSDEPEKFLFGLIGLRQLLSKEESKTIQSVLDMEIIPLLINLMSCSSSNKIQQPEAAKCVARLCVGPPKQIESLIEKGMISGFLAGLKLKDSEVVEQCLKGLGLIAEKHYKFREKIFEAQAVEKIVEALEDTKSLDVKRNGIFTLMTLCRQKPEPTYELISKAIPLFCHYLKNENDEQILIDASWGLSGASSTEKGVESILNCAIG